MIEQFFYLSSMISPSYRMISQQANRSFIFKWEHFDLTTRWHYHPEIELIYFIEGKTTAVIGDGFQHFNEGELVLLGPNFPHVLQEDKSFSYSNPDCRPFGLIIQFTEDFMGTDFLRKPELGAISNLLNKSRRGLHFRKEVLSNLENRLLKMHTLTESRKLISLLDILETLAENDDFEFMTHENYDFDNSDDEKRLRQINQYVYEHFREKITVKEIASVANMTETSFCRYFRTRTLKNFTRYLNEIRISYACKLLSNTDYSITTVCFDSGFNELSYFTRQFKKIMHLTPKAYQQWKKGIPTEH